MTENEIKEFISDIRRKAEIFRNSGFATTGVATVFDKSADIIEELLEYKAIGTVEDIEKSMQNVSALLAEHELLKLYQSIGTVEEFKALKEKEHNYENCHNFSCRNKSRELGFNIGYNKAIDEFAEALKKELSNYDFWKYDIVTDLGVMEKGVTRDYFIDEIAEQLKGGAV